MDIKALGPRAAAMMAHMGGEGLESNPYQKGTKDHERFSMVMHQLQREELQRLSEEIKGGV